MYVVYFLDNVNFSTREHDSSADSVMLPLPGIREPKQLATSGSCTEHRDPHSLQAGYSPTENNRSYKSQNSLEVYLPTVDGKSFINVFIHLIKLPY